MPRRNQQRTRRVFIETHGNGPWICTYTPCGEVIEKLGKTTRDGVVHHVDEDPSNDAPENLVPMHHGCHLKHHHLGKPKSEVSERTRALWADGRMKRHDQTPETRAKISAGLIGRPVSTNTRDKIANTLRGRPHTDERRANLRAAWVRRKAKQSTTQGEQR